MAERDINTTNLIGLPTLMTIAFTGGDLDAVGKKLVERIEQNPEDANALMDMAVIFVMRGDLKMARSLQTLALETRQIYHYPRPACEAKIRILAILGPGDLMANSPFEFLIDQQPVAFDMLYITPTMHLPHAVPDHDVLVVAIAESEANQPLLHYLDDALSNWPKPVINRPERIRQLARDANYALLSNVPGLSIPKTLRVLRDALEVCCRPPELARPLSEQLQGIDYPFIIRPIDSHAGQGLSKIETLADLTRYLVTSDDKEFFAAPFIDYRSKDGLFRKYRVILIDGAPYLCHMAISRRWMVHYLNADMLDNAAHRDEEAHMMATFKTTFASRHAPALNALYQALGLDYVGIDCAETPDGQLLIFEVDSNMVVHNMDPADKFPYKKIQMPKLFHAFVQLLAQRSGKTL